MAGEVKKDCCCWSREKAMLILIASLEKTRKLFKDPRNEESEWIDVNYVRRIVSWTKES